MKFRFQFNLRTMLIAITIIAIASAYVGSYYRLSRRGIIEAEKFGLEGFLYIPFEDAARTHDLRRHHYLSLFYLHVNYLDQELFDGRGPTACILWGLSGGAKQPSQ